MTHPSQQLMERAIAIAKENHKEGGHAIAALIIKGDAIIAEAFTTLVKEKDPTCHAEINAIRIAAKALDSFNLEDCYLYTTYEPCPMCTSAAIWARMKGIVYGASREDRNEKYGWRILIPASEIISHGTPQLELHENFMREECKKLLEL